MANYTGGDILEAVCNHPVLGSFRFQAKANEAFTLDKGGIRNADDTNSITGSGQAIYQKNRARWSLEGQVAVDFLSDNEMAGLSALAASPIEGIWTLSHISGAIYKGSGMPVGDLNPDTNTAQIKLKVAGSNQLQKI